MYTGSSAKAVYKYELKFDSEGFLGNLTGCVITYLGIITGHILIHYQDHLKRVIRLFFYAILWGILALVLCGFSFDDDDGWIPINKNLWSLSFVLISASISLIVFIVIYILTDMYDLFSGAPFRSLGLNSIVIYLGQDLFANKFPMLKVPIRHPELLAIDAYWVVLWTLIAAYMDYKKFYISL